jgi:hypothetical protein
MDFAHWIEYGIKEGFCTAVYCDTHDGIPVTNAELEMWDQGEDPCHHSVRLIAGIEELKELARKN